MRTLTRRQAAARLGKSIATIRRLEGTHLNPRLVAGVYRFDPDEVDALRGESFPEAWGLAAEHDGDERADLEEAIQRESEARREAEHARDELQATLERTERELRTLREENAAPSAATAARF